LYPCTPLILTDHSLTCLPSPTPPSAPQSPYHVLGLPVGQHITLRCKNKTTGEDVQRSYTPISSNDDKGFVEFVIKVYFPNVHPRFPNGGAMTMHLQVSFVCYVLSAMCRVCVVVSRAHVSGRSTNPPPSLLPPPPPRLLQSLKVGDRVDMRGPKGTLSYEGRGAFSVNAMNTSTGKRDKKLYQKKRFGFVAGGSGITPCLQVISAMLKDPSDASEIWLLYANQTEKDILLRERLEQMADKFPQRFRLHFTLDTAPKRGWKGSEGFIDTAMCKRALPPPKRSADVTDDTDTDTDAFIFICGPPPMIKFAVEPALREIGFKDGEWMAF